MRNQERAAKALARATPLGPGVCHDLAGILDNLGLITPDLPEPLTAVNGNPVWRADQTLMVTRYPDGEIAMLINLNQEARYTPETARAQAALLLAAANETEKRA